MTSAAMPVSVLADDEVQSIVNAVGALDGPEECARRLRAMMSAADASDQELTYMVVANYPDLKGQCGPIVLDTAPAPHGQR